MDIGDCMKRQIISMSPADTVAQAAAVVATNRVGSLPIVDSRGLLIGIVRLQDVLKVFMPDFVALLDNIDFVADFGAVEQLRPRDVPAAARRTMAELMSPAVAVRSTCGLLRSFAIMTKHQLQDLPVIDAAGRLVGLASRVDIAAAFFASFGQQEGGP